jgi:hypothetical protein
LNAAPIQGQVNQVGVFQTSFPAGKEKAGMLVHGPELPQHPQGFVRQRHQSVLVAFGITNMDPHLVRVNIADSEPDAFAKTQPHAVAGEKEDFVAQDRGCGKQLPHLFGGKDIRDSGYPGRLDQGDIFPGFVQYPGVEELQTIKVELDRAPGMRVQEFREIIAQLAGVEIVNSAIEIVADTPDRPGVGVNGLWLQTAQLEALQMLLVLLVEAGILRQGGVRCNLLGNG